MQTEQRTEKEKIERIRRKRQALHRIFVYTACLLIAVAVWIVVSYTMWRDEREEQTSDEETAVVSDAQSVALPYAETASLEI